MKLVTITLLKVAYSGESVGRDIRIETTILEKKTVLDRRIPFGLSVSLSHIIANIETEENSFRSDLSVTVIEKDFLWSDSGQATVSIETDTESGNTKEQTITVSVHERRSFFDRLFGRKKIANFELMFQVNMYDIAHMIARTEDGWIEVVPEWQQKTVWLPELLRVRLLRQENARDYFQILEGYYANKYASVKSFFDSGKSSIVPGEPSTPAVMAEYSISKQTVTLDNVSYKAKDYEGAPWQKGTYIIHIPDHPHAGGLEYKEYAHARSWFLIGFESDRYLHVGLVSLGCITISAEQDWEKLYEILIRARTGDGASIGVLHVVD